MKLKSLYDGWYMEALYKRPIKTETLSIRLHFERYKICCVSMSDLRACNDTFVWCWQFFIRLFLVVSAVISTVSSFLLHIRSGYAYHIRLVLIARESFLSCPHYLSIAFFQVFNNSNEWKGWRKKCCWLNKFVVDLTLTHVDIRCDCTCVCVCFCTDKSVCMFTFYATQNTITNKLNVRIKCVHMDVRVGMCSYLDFCKRITNEQRVFYVLCEVFFVGVGWLSCNVYAWIFKTMSDMYDFFFGLAWFDIAMRPNLKSASNKKKKSPNNAVHPSFAMLK